MLTDIQKKLVVLYLLLIIALCCQQTKEIIFQRYLCAVVPNYRKRTFTDSTRPTEYATQTHPIDVYANISVSAHLFWYEFYSFFCLYFNFYIYNKV
jgi:hypothetical protein